MTAVGYIKLATSAVLFFLTGCAVVIPIEPPGEQSETITDWRIVNYRYQESSETIELAIAPPGDDAEERWIAVDVRTGTVERRFEKNYLGFSGERPAGVAMFINGRVLAQSEKMYRMIGRLLEDAKRQLSEN